MKTIAIACGGSGGHIYPGLTLGHQLRTHGFDVVFMGSTLRMEKEKIPQAGFSFMGVPVRPFNRRRPLASAYNWWRCIGQARAYLKQKQPVAMVGMGSYISVPALVAARQLGIPIFLVETNKVPGKANQMLARLSQWVSLAYPESARAFPKTETFVDGTPVRPEFGSIDRETGAKAFGLNPEHPVLTITGGSQGAKAINDAVLHNLRDLLQIEGLQIVHMCGAANFDQIRAEPILSGVQDRYHLLEYVENMPALLAVTDLGLVRAGALTIAEMMACEIPVILVPGTFGGGHQKDNALAVEAAGAGIMLEEPQLQEKLVQTVRDVILSTEKQQQMRQNSKTLNTRDAADHIVTRMINSLTV